jgi:hypothetical protein
VLRPAIPQLQARPVRATNSMNGAGGVEYDNDSSARDDRSAQRTANLCSLVSKKTMTKVIAVAICLLAGPAWAQVAVQVRTEKPQFLAGEPIFVIVEVKNVGTEQVPTTARRSSRRRNCPCATASAGSSRA